MRIKSFFATITLILYSSLSNATSQIEKATTYPIREIGSNEYLFNKNIDYKVTVLYKENKNSKETEVISKSFTYTNKNEMLEKISKSDVGSFKIFEDPYKTSLVNDLQLKKILKSNLTKVDEAYLNGEYKEAPTVYLQIERGIYKFVDYLFGKNKGGSDFIEMKIKTATSEYEPKLMTIIKYTTIQDNKTIDKYLTINRTTFPKQGPYKQIEKIDLNEYFKLIIETNIQ